MEAGLRDFRAALSTLEPNRFYEHRQTGSLFLRARGKFLPWAPGRLWAIAREDLTGATPGATVTFPARKYIFSRLATWVVAGIDVMTVRITEDGYWEDATAERDAPAAGAVREIVASGVLRTSAEELADLTRKIRDAIAAPNR